jgi:uncharacterized protein YkvS
MGDAGVCSLVWFVDGSIRRVESVRDCDVFVDFSADKDIRMDNKPVTEFPA